MNANELRIFESVVARHSLLWLTLERARDDVPGEVRAYIDDAMDRDRIEEERCDAALMPEPLVVNKEVP